MALLDGIVDEGPQLRARLDESAEALAELRKALDHAAVEDCDRAHGKQTHHGAHFQPLGPAVGQPQHVVEEPVLLVPHPHAFAGAHQGRPDPEEVLDELEGHVRVDRPVHRQLGGDLDHVLAEERHPRGAVGLLEVAAGGERRAAVEDADVVEAQEPALESVVAGAVLAVHPPGEVQNELVEGALEPVDVPLAAAHALQGVREDGGPGVHGRIDVAEVPLVGGDLPAGMQVGLPEHQVELLLAEVLVHQREGEHVEGEVPRRVPGVLPLVRHRDDVGVVHVMPVLVARGGAPVGLEGGGAALLEPAVDVVVVELLGPEHAGEGLPHHVGGVGVHGLRDDGGVELVGLPPACLHDRVERAAEGRGGRGVVKPQPERLRLAGLDGEGIVRGGLRALLLGIHRVRAAMDDAAVDPVLDEGRPVGGVEETLGVGLVLGEEERGRAITGEVPRAELGVIGARSPPGPPAAGAGRAPLPPHDHVLRNHTVGSTWSVAGSGPRFSTVIRTRMSSGEALAYSTNTSK